MDPKGNILIVDDEPDFLEFVKWQLKKLDYLVETSLSGEDALEILSGRDIQVLIADIRMPGIDGIELIRQALQLKPDLQCIVITGHGGIETAVEAMKLGAINYLRKPVGVEMGRDNQCIVKRRIVSVAFCRNHFHCNSFFFKVVPCDYLINYFIPTEIGGWLREKLFPCPIEPLRVLIKKLRLPIVHSNSFK